MGLNVNTCFDILATASACMGNQWGIPLIPYVQDNAVGVRTEGAHRQIVLSDDLTPEQFIGWAEAAFHNLYRANRAEMYFMGAA